MLKFARALLVSSAYVCGTLIVIKGEGHVHQEDY